MNIWTWACNMILINSSKNSRNVIHLWEGSWCLQTQQISIKFWTGLPQSICRPYKTSSRTPAQVRNIIIISSQKSTNVINLWGDSWCLQTHRISSNFKHRFLRACADHLRCHQGHRLIISTSQEHPVSSKPPAMSSIFEHVLDAFKLNKFQPDFKQSFLRS